MGSRGASPRCGCDMAVGIQVGPDEVRPGLRCRDHRLPLGLRGEDEPSKHERAEAPAHPPERDAPRGLPPGVRDSLAEALGVCRQTMNEFLREHRAVSPEMALRLSRLFSNSPEFWLNAQRAVDLWDAAKSLRTKVERIKPLKVA
jgi:addiction module HigA family antidote